MPVINPSFTVTITPRRPGTDFGEEVFTELPALQAVISLSAAATQNQNRFTQTGTVFVPRGSDLKSADRFDFNTTEFIVSGTPRGNWDHPISGEDFGWVAYPIEASG